MSRPTRTVPLFLCVSTLSSGALCACVGSFAAPEDAFSRNIAPPPATEGAGLVGARVRLLNRFEYNNTIRALFGDTTDPADAFPPAATQSGFSKLPGAMPDSASVVSGRTPRCSRNRT